MSANKLYGKKFYDKQGPSSAASAKLVVPHIVELFQPTSAIDIGCGIGTWCAALADAGVGDVYGLDGPWVEAERFALGPQRFIPFDFDTAAKPYAPPLPRARFDLLVSFEFLEHVDPMHAADIVAFMTATADIIVAGAAPPGQGGKNHVNEQWPSYWAKQFAAQGFVAYDALRPSIWNLEGVEPWYLQNPICYFKGSVPTYVAARTEKEAADLLRAPQALVHPELLRRKASSLKRRKRGIFKRLFGG
jgi:SAM-dependent methyltransferase